MMVCAYCGAAVGVNTGGFAKHHKPGHTGTRMSLLPETRHCPGTGEPLVPPTDDPVRLTALEPSEAFTWAGDPGIIYVKRNTSSHSRFRVERDTQGRSVRRFAGLVGLVDIVVRRVTPDDWDYE